MAKIFAPLKNKAKVSEKTLEIVRRIHSGTKLMYDCDYHCALLIEIFDRGEDIAMFCSHIGIGRSTFYDWINTYPAFAAAYEIAREASRTRWEYMGGLERGIVDNSFNTTLWSINMRNRFDYTEHRRLKIAGMKEAKTIQEQQQVLANEIAEGRLTAPEAMQMTNVILGAVKIEEATEVKDRLSVLEQAVSK